MRIGIVIGSDSDLPVMEAATEVLEQFGVPYELEVRSAHRTPRLVEEYAATAEERGVTAIIAAAGCAAHLPGVIAAHTVLPVIGVPIDASPLSGVDALYSIVQMPSGVPVATVGINGAKNAALLAIQIAAAADEKLRGRLRDYKRELAEAGERKTREHGFKSERDDQRKGA
ncbi:MAG: 5-(carboxyamino)imidazole ribonucleotide mutase [Armatimonadota bacterium]